MPGADFFAAVVAHHKYSPICSPSLLQPYPSGQRPGERPGYAFGRAGRGVWDRVYSHAPVSGSPALLVYQKRVEQSLLGIFVPPDVSSLGPPPLPGMIGNWSGCGCRARHRPPFPWDALAPPPLPGIPPPAIPIGIPGIPPPKLPAFRRPCRQKVRRSPEETARRRCRECRRAFPWGHRCRPSYPASGPFF